MNHEGRYFDPTGARLVRDDHHRLRLEAGGETFEDVRASRAFPLTAPDSCIFFRDADDHEIGAIEDPSRLDPASRRALDEELTLTYLMPQVQAVNDVKSSHGVTTWEFVTDRGACTVHVKDRGDIRRLSARRILFTDVNGLKFEIRNMDALDERSQAFVDAET